MVFTKRRMMTVLRYSGVFSSVIMMGSAFAGGFQLWEQDSSGVGDYHAGAAAEGDTAGSEFYNAASVIRLKKPQVSFGAALIAIDANYTGVAQVFVSPSAPPFTLPVNNAPGGKVAAVPNFHIVAPFAHYWAFTFGITTPFGLETDYPDVAPVNLLATKTKLQTINLNPSLVYAVNKYVSIAAGFDALYGSADYDSDIFSPITSELKGWDYGYNAGVMVQFTPNTRVGVSYRSAITIDAQGDSTSTSILSGLPVNGKTSAAFPLPATTIFGVFHRFNDQFSVMASAFYTQWSSFGQLVLKNLATPAGISTITINENYVNTWNFALGGKYHIDKHITLQAGVGHDETPTQNFYRDIRLPDNSRWVMALGLTITPKPGFHWSMGWTHLFLPPTPIDNSRSYNAAGSTGNSRPSISIGQAKGNVNIFGIQLAFDV